MKIKPILEEYKGEMKGCLYKVDNSYYYKVFYKINDKYKVISQSYVNLYDRALCFDRMIHDMNIIEESRLKRLK